MQPLDRDPQLWRVARARAKFKSHLVTYLLVNALLWAIWYFTDGAVHYRRHGFDVPWPVWSTLFWGLGVAVQGLSTYGFVSQHSWSEREYQRLLRDRDAGRL
ncbi:2TM domain-containing protein [Hymenobacter sp. 15J16-1T3B]|uniref:2TM domain-containing protein n=1 Tax=Hymenobacter sp. 15J16-1T3B TaxID=2886941 RepID=UPI001D10354A|nr:2TM domain-containing protein [Hymenobacter sp. 15J16-1T3B]MCC3158111.1 2TM domain-containing protein [Hymenobacter sp. 15J16-1T3B]